MAYVSTPSVRAYHRQWAANRRKAKREAEQQAHPLGPLGWQGERLIKKWVRHGEALLRRMIRSQQVARENRAELRIYWRAWYAKNRERALAQKAAWLEKHPEFKEYQKKWMREHPDVRNMETHKRRARKVNAPINDLTAAQWQEIKEAFAHRCSYCPADCQACKRKTHKLTPDHVTPYAKNGSNTLWNVIPACKSCNCRKGPRPPLKPVQPLLLTIAPSKKPKVTQERLSNV